jgi:predicted ABC-type ATPase
MDFQAVFMMGPPGAGKSFVKAKVYLKHTGFHDIDSDEMKKRHPDYDPNNPGLVHEWSLQEQVVEFRKVLPTGEPFVYDGTGWDPRPVTERILEAKAAGYRTFLVYVHVPVEVSLFRNRNRGRFVPEAVIIDKATKVEHAFGILRHRVDKFKVIENFTHDQLEEAQRDMAVYPPPQAKVPPRPGDPDYGEPVGMTASRRGSW